MGKFTISQNVREVHYTQRTREVRYMKNRFFSPWSNYVCWVIRYGVHGTRIAQTNNLYFIHQVQRRRRRRRLIVHIRSTSICIMITAYVPITSILICHCLYITQYFYNVFTTFLFIFSMRFPVMSQLDENTVFGTFPATCIVQFSLKYKN